MTAWGVKQNLAARLWTEVAATVVDPDRVRQASDGAVPRHEWFSLVDNFTRVLGRAGLIDVHVETREYTVEMMPADYVAMKVDGTDGALIRQVVSDIVWSDFQRQVGEAFRERFPGRLTFVRDVHFGVGMKP